MGSRRVYYSKTYKKHFYDYKVIWIEVETGRAYAPEQFRTGDLKYVGKRSGDYSDLSLAQLEKLVRKKSSLRID